MPSFKKLLSQTTYLIFSLTLLGLAVSSYLAYEYILSGPIGCPIGGNGCQIVRLSQFSNFFGISVPVLGVVYYFFAAVLVILLLEQKKQPLKKMLLIWSGLGFLFSVYLTSLETFIIKAYCFWCVISAIIATAIFVLTVTGLKNPEIRTIKK